jgi:hypothetical protein
LREKVPDRADEGVGPTRDSFSYGVKTEDFGCQSSLKDVCKHRHKGTPSSGASRPLLPQAGEGENLWQYRL